MVLENLAKDSSQLSRFLISFVGSLGFVRTLCGPLLWHSLVREFLIKSHERDLRPLKKISIPSRSSQFILPV